MSDEPKTAYSFADLDRIERYARHAMNNGVSITGAVRVLRSRPPFEARAEEALRLAETQLEITLRAVREAMAEYSTKPVNA